MSRYYIILLCSLLGIFSCKTNANESSEESSVPVLPITHPVIKDTLMDQPYVTNIQAIKNVEIRSRVRGILENTFVDEGEVVKKGQVLFKISNDELQIQLDQSKAAVSSAIADASAAEIEQNRVQGLVKKKVVTPSELDLSKERLLALQAKVAEAKAIRDNFAKQLSYTYIKAPFNGVIDRLPLKVGSLVEEGSLFTNISDLTTMFAYFDLPETEYLKLIRANADNKSAIYSDSASLLLTDGSPYPYKGKIQRSESVIDPGTGSIAYRAIFSNPLKILHHNSSGTVILHKEVKNAILIPQKCVFEIQDKNYVFAVNDSNVVHMKSFEPGSRVGKYYIVLSGIDLKDKIVYEGVQNLRDGMKIEIRKN
ncbi:efflux RND transporter periplasmic adaptor subunit [Rhizosphaericola mali]|uniref:Efflux RND transporter periplasmic adaptor subunit n=1 Tax=Rhizosphaericola mali TaxID=2545455 RepID=A0A5P2FZU8_9BACT|nr:efflux RND transporter periplasmic adaptor subunit [Rhizosphaericola mali]QES89066.1 efflux RND transporter periplasmic adaptor subunit [Rhizosphaericola mali]